MSSWTPHPSLIQEPPTHTNGEQLGTTDLGASSAWRIFLAPV